MSKGRDASKLNVKRWARWSLLLACLTLGCQVLFGEVEVKPVGGANPGDCVAGDLRCNGEYLLNCGSTDTGWMLKDTCGSEVLCDAKLGHCAVCRDGDFRCNGATRQQCASDGATWKTLEECAAENQCSESSCGACPTEGALDCSLGSKLRECRSGVWKDLDTCVSSAVCTATIVQAMNAGDAWDHKCAPAGCSPPSSYQCDGTTLQRCRSDQSAWDTVDTCATAGLCTATIDAVNAAKAAGVANADAAVDPNSNASAIVDMCKTGCPAAGAFFCAGTTLQKCGLDQVSYEDVTVCDASTECDPVAGICGQLCTPGHYQCNAAALRKCGADGHWKDQATCETAELCSATADGVEGHCTPSPCGAADYQCSGVSLQKCKADRTGYQEVDSCQSAALCDAKSQRCIEPTCPVADGFRCFGQDLKQCSTDLVTWNPVKTCPTGQYCDSTSPGCLTSCPANPIRCNGKVLEECSAAKGWSTKATCATADLCACTQTNPPSCSKGVKDGCGNVACTAGSFQCSGTDLQKCQAGQNGYDNTAACGKYIYDGNPSLCYAGTGPAFKDGYCLTCPAAGEHACNLGNGVLQTCSSDRRSWSQSPSACQYGCVALTNAEDYCAVCQAGAVRCTGTNLENCPTNAKAWNQQKCNSDALCDAAHNQCDQCSQTTCSGTTLQVCSADGQKQTNTTCATSALCNAGKSQCDTPACAVGQFQCVGAALQICNPGRTAYVASATCDSAALCDSTAKMCKTKVCDAGQTQCTGAVLQTCKADLTGFATTQTCASAALCNAPMSKCDPACMAGDKQCSGAIPQTCKADLSGWNNGTTCGAVGCTAGACNACSAGQHQCSAAGNSQKCNSDQSGFDDTVCGAAGCSTATGLCNACAVGQMKCAATGNFLQVCNAAQTGFGGGTDCGIPGCNTATNTCKAPLCTAGSFNCEGLKHQTCNVATNAWVTDETCLVSCSESTGCTNTNCDVTTYVPTCNGNSLVTCSAANLLTSMPCGADVCDPVGGVCAPAP